MRNVDQIRFVTANLSSLQGLKGVPIGLLLAFVSIWSYKLQGPATDLTLPILAAVVASVLYLVIDRYYKRAFGRVERTTKSRLIELGIGALAGIFALAAFWFDTLQKIPISIFGLVFAAGILVDYFRMTWPIRSRSIAIYPIMPIVAALMLLMLLVSFLPLFGEKWLRAVGIVSPLHAVWIIIGFIVAITGILSHFYLIHSLASFRKLDND